MNKYEIVALMEELCLRTVYTFENQIIGLRKIDDKYELMDFNINSKICLLHNKINFTIQN